MEQGETVVPNELQYVEVIAVTDKRGNDEQTTTVRPDGDEETELPETVTLLVTPLQANILAELEANGEIHLSLVYRGTAENAKKFIAAQEKLITELEEKDREDSEQEKDKETPSQSTTPEDNNSGSSADSSESEDPALDEVIITPDTDNSKTEVNSDAETV